MTLVKQTDNLSDVEIMGLLDEAYDGDYACRDFVNERYFKPSGLDLDAVDPRTGEKRGIGKSGRDDANMTFLGVSCCVRNVRHWLTSRYERRQAKR